MKFFTDLFNRRPVLAIVVNLVILIAGLQAWTPSQRFRQYPRSDNAVGHRHHGLCGRQRRSGSRLCHYPAGTSIAAADGIDYIESSSKLGLSTITVRLKLNDDPNKALAEISSKVNQVRNDLPPEAQVPVINVESADSRFAAAYLSFTSDILQANQISGLPGPGGAASLSALEGVQRADFLGGRTFAMRIWLKTGPMAALTSILRKSGRRWRPITFCPRSVITKGSLVQVNLTANTDPALSRRVSQPGGPPVG